ncbi:MAG: hypothetical protein Q8R37_03190 [Nanoarchaeota archaeon]|nr:hypothetical protein [Nanoarchaeota archaeon]
MKKRGAITISFVLITVLFLLTACQRVPGGERPEDTAAALRQVQVGTQGIEAKVLPNYPPPTIYDQNELITIVEVRNRGNNNLEPQECFVRINGFDPNIVGGDYQRARSCAENIGLLEGKTVFNIEGSFNQIEFRTPNIVLPAGVPDYDPALKILACYNYHTRANPQVCIDPLRYQVTAEQKTCTPQNVAMGGGQGGPVGVTYVGVEMTGSKAIFDINVANLGPGRVLSPYTDIQSCNDASIDRTDFDKVAYSVELASGALVDCKPRDGFVRLSNGQGKILCTFNIPGTTAYETPLLIDLDYGYIQSSPMSVRIIKTPE